MNKQEHILEIMNEIINKSQSPDYTDEELMRIYIIPGIKKLNSLIKN